MISDFQLLTRDSGSGRLGGEMGGSQTQDGERTTSCVDRDEGRRYELTPDQTCKRLEDPTVPLTRKRTLLDLCLYPK